MHFQCVYHFYWLLKSQKNPLPRHKIIRQRCEPQNYIREELSFWGVPIGNTFLDGNICNASDHTYPFGGKISNSRTFEEDIQLFVASSKLVQNEERAKLLLARFLCSKMQLLLGGCWHIFSNQSTICIPCQADFSLCKRSSTLISLWIEYFISYPVLHKRSKVQQPFETKDSDILTTKMASVPFSGER